VEGGILLYRLVRLPEGRIAHIEKHGTEAIGDARVTGEKSVDCKGRWFVGCKLLICGVVDCLRHFAVLLFLHLSHLQHFFYETGIIYPPMIFIFSSGVIHEKKIDVLGIKPSKKVA
jgi:hypothetical protein